MKEQEHYTQPSKATARSQLIHSAVNSLCSERSKSALVRIDEFNETLTFALKQLARSQYPSNDLLKDIDSEVDRWREFYADQVGLKVPRQLKVLFLAGPEPMNDVNEFLRAGVRSENIWAVEGDRTTYQNAVQKLRLAGANIKIYGGSLQSFLEKHVDQFDLVYYDACGPLPGGRPNTLHPLVRLSTHARLANICALITNFCEPPEGKIIEYSELLSNFFAVRNDGLPDSIRRCGIDPALAQYEPELLHATVQSNLNDVYSDFVSRLLIELFRSVFPWWRVAGTDEFRRTFFVEPTQLRTKIEKAAQLSSLDFHKPNWFEKFFQETDDLYLNPSGYPLTTFFRRSETNALIQNLLNEKYVYWPSVNRTLGSCT